MDIEWKELAVEIIFLALLAVAGYFILRGRQKTREEEEKNDKDNLN